MEVNNFLSSVFCSNSCESSASPRNLLEFTNLQEYLENILSLHNNENKTVYTEQEKALLDGRIGSDIVKIDQNGRCGNMDISENLELDSQSNFSSLRASVCICKGKWMFEVLLGTKGIMQLGWATVNCQFTNEEGVGDTADSYAYDGHRVRKWNLSASAYGELWIHTGSWESSDGKRVHLRPTCASSMWSEENLGSYVAQEWMAGDVIGCTFDLDNGDIAYYRNGKEMGVAYKDIPRGAGIAYFPAVSLSYCESCQLNFGATPFKFPIANFKPLQDPPVVELAQAKELFEFLDRFLPGPARIPRMPSNLGGKSATLSLLTSHHVFEKLAPLLSNAYLIEEVLIPFLLNSCSPSANPCEQHAGVKKILDLMWACMEDFEIKPCLKYLFHGLMKAYWHLPVLCDFKTQTESLSLVLSTLRHDQTRKFWISMKSFPHKFCYFMHIRPPDDAILMELFPVVWYEDSEVLKDMFNLESKKKEDHERACENLQSKIQVLENIHVEMCKTLLEKDCLVEGQPSTRLIFLEKFRKYLQENMFIALSSHPPSSCSGPVLTCFFHRYMQALRWHWDKWAEENASKITSQNLYIPVSAFVDKSINYFELSRVGGITSHLRKNYSEKLKNSCPTDAKEDPEVKGESCPPSTEASDEMDITLVEAVDTLVMLYYFGVHRQFSKVRSVRDNLNQNIKALEETVKKIKKCPEEKSDVLTELHRSRKVFVRETSNFARQMAWVRSLIFTKEKQEDVYWMLNTALRTLQHASEDKALFDFVPEIYFEAVNSAYSALRNLFSPTVPFNELPDREQLLQKMAIFFADNFCETKIVNPDLRDTLMQGLVTFSCYADCLKALELLPYASQVKIVSTLMSAYEKRTWVQTTWILIRFWKGCGFAFNYTLQSWNLVGGVSDHGLQRVNLQPPCPSQVYQDVLAKLCVEDKSLSSSFLNGVLNQLNWAFSEFIGMLQQIQSLPNTSIENRQLKTCIVCFELTVGLLRVLEMVASVVPQLFTDWKNFPSAELNISRLFQLVTQAFHRLTASANIFENVTRLHLPGFDSVDRFPLLSAVTGILLALLKRGKPSSIECACTAFLSEHGFQIESFKQLFERKSNNGRATSKFSFSNYKEVSESELKELEELIAFLSSKKSEVNLKRQASVEADELCTICYAMPQTAVFVPCGHMSCRACIARHLMNNTICFFCKETVEKFEEKSQTSPNEKGS